MMKLNDKNMPYLNLSGVVGKIRERVISFDAGFRGRFQTLLEIFSMSCQLIIRNMAVNTEKSTDIRNNVSIKVY